ncbi:disintegrin and metalloproteinase domain-containing protein 12-like isoform X2 [Dreissena polymorpha]|uniref:disintegrin and metalloproteinase domain-containing protein 12-like isoform X2 n=1 Tax=Dreissena polymorpha TaxID=45954 RepID=UPI0022655344|nr:disintegrin and metalloproteinase domain-containing protein 12-like isoform X2 [Dreissena polymorpha]
MDVNVLICVLIYSCAIHICLGVRRRQNDLNDQRYKRAVTEFSQHEVVYPRLYDSEMKEIKFSKSNMGHPKQLSVHIVTADGILILQLERNSNLLTKSFIEKNIEDEDRFRLKKLKPQELTEHCFYHGSVQGHSSSLVAVSTCEGVSGYIQTDREAYHIEPGLDMGDGAHKLNKDIHKKDTPHNCGTHPTRHSSKLNETVQIDLTHSYLRRKRRSLVEPYDANLQTRYVEMYVVNDFRTFDSNNRDVAYQTRKTQNIINIVSRLYRPFNIYIALVGVENWTKEDLFQIVDEADTTLQSFLHYRKERINPYHRNDNSQLITTTSFSNGVVGKAIKGTICTYQYSGGVNLNLATEAQTATTIAHELGHNFGMDHDNYTICKCPVEKCIMASTSGGVNVPTKWSSCSMTSLYESFEMVMDYCLRNVPETLYAGPDCGNGFTEAGEECDCGALEECHNKCCNATTCRLTRGSQCAAGACCDLDTCKPRAAATLCRAQVGECDLPEFCLGDNPACPSDVFLQDGLQCGNGQAFCYKGKCSTHTGQCRLLWGSTGRVSDPVCFKHLNTNGSKHGNCGYNWTQIRYLPCLRDDVMCGLLHCVHQNEKLMFWKDSLTHTTPATFLTIGTTTHVCRGAMLDVGLDMPDPGMVPDGAKCDEKKMCLNQKCRSISELGFLGCEGGCSKHGVCNSKGNCHCEEGWGPPSCNGAGNGGSVDSGPIKIEESRGLLVTLLVLFLVVLPLLAFLAFLLYYFRHSLQAWWHSRFDKTAKNQNRPARPSRPPPKTDPHPSSRRDPPPPPSKPLARPLAEQPGPHHEVSGKSGIDKSKPKSKPMASVQISHPVLTDSTHEDSKAHIQTSPVADHKKIQRPPPPKLPLKVSKQDNKGKTPGGACDTKTEPGTSESKSRFGPIFKIPSFSKADKLSTPKPEQSADTDPASGNVVKKRELTRNISNPVLISTTDRRSKHLVKAENHSVAQIQLADRQASVEAPPLPPHIDLKRSESDIARRNRPLPPRPVSMPESESGEEPNVTVSSGRKSAVFTSNSPRMPQRPPPPPIKPGIDSTRKTIEDELAKLDSINITIPDMNSRPSTPKAVHPKTKDIKPKPRPGAQKTTSSDAQKPLPPAKSPAVRSKSDSNKLEDVSKPKEQRTDIKPGGDFEVKKPIFIPKARPGLGKTKAKTETPKENITEIKRKISTDSLDEDPNAGSASVAGLSRIFDTQTKPLLSESALAEPKDKGLKKTVSQGSAKAPMTPPKPRPGVKFVRSVDV